MTNTDELAREAAILSAMSGGVRLWLGLAADDRVAQFWLRPPVAQAHAGLRLVEYVCMPAAAAQVADSGWKLVPLEPTEDMVEIGRECASAAIYRRMVAAAPAPTEAQ